MPPILIDTNLLIHLYDFRDPGKQSRSAEVLNELGVSGSGRLSVQGLAEFLSVATWKLVPPLPPEDAIRQVESFMRLWPVFDLTPLMVLEAGRGVRDHRLSYYGAQIWASARLNQVPVIFSEDFTDGSMLEGVRFVDPFADGFVLEEWT
jgi:predicted nucleic acid-binding protein